MFKMQQRDRRETYKRENKMSFLWVSYSEKDRNKDFEKSTSSVIHESNNRSGM